MTKTRAIHWANGGERDATPILRTSWRDCHWWSRRVAANWATKVTGDVSYVTTSLWCRRFATKNGRMRKRRRAVEAVANSCYCCDDATTKPRLDEAAVAAKND